jgi:hypothetical protein
MDLATQAVIAIELRHRTDDLSESLEQQTATSEILQVISTWPGELAPVFASILANARRICEAKFAHLLLYDGKLFHAAAMEGASAAFVEFWAISSSTLSRSRVDLASRSSRVTITTSSGSIARNNLRSLPLLATSALARNDRLQEGASLKNTRKQGKRLPCSTKHHSTTKSL